MRRSKNPPQMATSWGRGASEHRPGVFTKRYFLEHDSACAADIYYSLGQELERINEERTAIGEKPFRRPNYSSFARYFHWFKLLGLIEPIPKREPAIYPFLRERQFYRLTEAGIADERSWLDPVRAAHPEFG